jgi:hypothetical protein
MPARCDLSPGYTAWGLRAEEFQQPEFLPNYKGGLEQLSKSKQMHGALPFCGAESRDQLCIAHHELLQRTSRLSGLAQNARAGRPNGRAEQRGESCTQAGEVEASCKGTQYERMSTLTYLEASLVNKAIQAPKFVAWSKLQNNPWSISNFRTRSRRCEKVACLILHRGQYVCQTACWLARKGLQY